MFKLNYFTECDFVGTIRYHKDKYPQRLGLYIDADDKKWDIRGIFYMDSCRWVQACPYSNLHPYYNDTSGMNFGWVSQQWKPYRLKETI